jgi:hypothetical protein
MRQLVSLVNAVSDLSPTTLVNATLGTTITVLGPVQVEIHPVTHVTAPVASLVQRARPMRLSRPITAVSAVMGTSVLLKTVRSVTIHVSLVTAQLPTLAPAVMKMLKAPRR